MNVALTNDDLFLCKQQESKEQGTIRAMMMRMMKQHLVAAFNAWCELCINNDELCIKNDELCI